MLQTRLLVSTTAMAVALTTWAVSPAPSAAGAASAPATAASAPASGGTLSRVVAAQAPGRVRWKRCQRPALREAGARCGSIAVPMDYSDPAAGTLRIRLSRVRHTARRYQGVMLLNPGGPGGPGVPMAALGRLMPGRSGAGYDWIGFDPRGVGSSRPALSCRPRYFHADRPPYVPSTDRLLRVWLARSAGYARSCARHGDLLEHMRTVDTARDMESIRRALEARRINFYGWSYGTYLGQVYSTMFPGRVRRMVLDSNVDPTLAWPQWRSEQTLAFERVFDEFFAWVARHRRAYHLGRTGAAVKRLYLQQRRVLRQRPAAGVLGPSEFDDAMAVTGYLEAVWPETARAFSAWVNRRNPRPLIRWWRTYDTPGDDNLLAAYLATQCTDGPLPTLPEELRMTRRLHASAPVAAWPNTWFAAPCFSWPVPAGELVEVEDTGIPALLFGQTLDGATPFDDNLAVREIFGRSRLVAIRGGATHGSTPELAGPCARARLAAYLRTGALPARKPGRRADVSCQAPPPPQPGAGASRGAQRDRRPALRLRGLTGLR